MDASFSARRRFRHAVILAHPDPRSFNASVAERYAKTVTALGHEVVIRDLYRLHFDPILKDNERPTASDYMLDGDVAVELGQLEGVDQFVLVYPIWFGLPPAMLKGYVDRVFGAGFSFRALRDRRRHPFLTGNRLLSFTSSGTSRPWLEEQGAWLSLKTIFDDYLRRAFSLEAAEHVHFDSIVDDMKPRFVEEHLFKVEETAKRVCAALPRPVGAPN